MIETGHETELATRFASTHDPQAREALILRYVPLVHYVLGRLGIFRSIGSDYDDLAGQGLLGLIDAVDRYDPAHGTQFSTYATLRIRGQILDHLRSIDWLPRTARQRARQVEEAITSLWGSLDRAPGDEELAAHLHMDIAQLRQALVDSSRVVLSLDSEVDGDGEDGSLH